MNGIVLIDKEKDYTSRDVVNIVGKELGMKKVGHTGTLDPMATGVLVICVGKATKLVEMLTATEKVYLADIVLGIDTDTLDTTGTILKEEDIFIEESKIEVALQEMTKTYVQEVPKYSAVKVNGKKLYEYARAGKNVVLPKKEVTIYELKRTSPVVYENGKTKFQVLCHVSKGTYIRSLIRDIAYTLGTIGVMSDLRRIKQGDFKIDVALPLEKWKEDKKIFSMSEVLSMYPHVTVTGSLEEDIRNAKKIKNIYQAHNVLFETEDHKVIAIYEEIGNGIMKPQKMILE